MRTPCTQRLGTDQQYLDICTSNPWAKKLSRLARPCRPRVDFHSSASSILRLSHGLEVRESYKLGTFAVTPMFWFSLLANEIAGNFISSSGCALDCYRINYILHFETFLNQEKSSESCLYLCKMMISHVFHLHGKKHCSLHILTVFSFSVFAVVKFTKS